jgi:FkbM family methyltransferase
MIFRKLKNLIKKDKWIKTSYSQSGEDLILNYITKVININQPTYIDIGAFHPFNLNNTAIFYLKGCRGINIDPSDLSISLFNKFRRNDKNLRLAVGNESSESIYYVMNAPTLNTLSKKDMLKYKEEGYRVIREDIVKVKSINEIISEYNDGIFPDILSLDAEGFDYDILNSIDFNKSKPKLICVETISFSVQGAGVKDQKLIDFVKSKGYMFYADTNINSIFVLEELWRNQKK